MTYFFYVKWPARSTDAPVFPEEILGVQARDRVKLVDSKENVQNEATAAGLQADIQANGRQDTTAIQYKRATGWEGGKPSKKFPCSLLRLAGCE